jgi:hypothetical protein
MDGPYSLFALIAVPFILGLMWIVFGAIGKVAETGAKAVGKKKDGPFAFFLFFLIIFLLLAYNTYKNNR